MLNIINSILPRITKLEASSTTMAQQSRIDLLLLLGTHLEQLSHSSEDMVRDLAFKTPAELLHSELSHLLSILYDP
jgi:hypothetical protein